MNVRTALIPLAFVSASAVSLLACGSKNPEPQNAQAFNAQQPQQQPGAPYAPGMAQPGQPAPGMAPTAAVPGTTPGATPVPTAAPATTAAPSAQQGMLDAAALEMIKAQITPLAKKHAPGMKPEGQIFGGAMTEGQTIEQQAMLYPGKCYTIVGIGMTPIQELDIQVAVTTPIPNIAPILAADNASGPQAIVAGSPNCYKIPPMMMVATPVKIVMKATKGQGPAGAQLYAK